MNPDDYDSDGNNIVPCPICLDVYCPSKEGGKCPEEDDFVNSMETPHLLGNSEVKEVDGKHVIGHRNTKVSSRRSVI